MSKHIKYGKTFGVLYDMYNKFLRTKYDSSNSDTAQEQFETYVSKTQPFGIGEEIMLKLFFLDLEHEFTHLYLPDSDFLDFLALPTIKDTAGIVKYIAEKGDTYCSLEDTLELEMSTSLALCVHPVNEKQGVVLYYCISSNTNKLYVLINQGKVFCGVTSDDFEKRDSSFNSDNERIRMGKIALNLISYMATFPDCLKEGTPHGVKTERNHYLKLSNKVMDVVGQKEKGVVNPHFRRGYFRYLSSDFFKNKKGQTVFVHETMVNGRAKTLKPAG